VTVIAGPGWHGPGRRRAGQFVQSGKNRRSSPATVLRTSASGRTVYVLSGAERTGPPGGGPARDARHGGGPAAGGPWRTKTKTGAANPPDRGDEVPADKW